ncbi:hypothetical protein K438DRAFT_2012565, partial [Mycena galopus ATCC 62051]
PPSPLVLGCRDFLFAWSPGTLKACTSFTATLKLVLKKRRPRSSIRIFLLHVFKARNRFLCIASPSKLLFSPTTSTSLSRDFYIRCCTCASSCPVFQWRR